MFVYELFEMNDSTIESLPTGYSIESDDQSVLKLSDMRKTRLTLGQLNKLRLINDIKKVEHSQKLKTISAQYKPPAAEAGMGM